jgi:hypothetical protein
VTSDDIIFRQRMQIFQDYDTADYTVTDLCKSMATRVPGSTNGGVAEIDWAMMG